MGVAKLHGVNGVKSTGHDYEAREADMLIHMPSKLEVTAQLPVVPSSDTEEINCRHSRHCR